MPSTYQPNFQIKEDAGVQGTDFDNLSPAELQKLINDTYRVKTGRPGHIASSAPPAAKRVVNLEQYLGGLHA